MMKFQVSKKIDAPDEDIWRIVRDVNGIPKYWHGTRNLTIIGKEGDGIRARVQFAFPGPFNKGEVIINMNEQEREVLMNYVKGPFTGVHKISVRGGEVISYWDVKYKFPFSLIESWNENHFKQGTVHALERIERELMEGRK
ncbi:hypothetical protein GCM10007981_09790 [Thermocladium modestius]|uniref:SRPBCC family protein n=2 Tax=Thermocladium modestius TaxID=62609 RepID=A0A830GVX3_9CREN|nr:hypothetical protein GCM10007981_09790 [Thermocladium modestius]